MGLTVKKYDLPRTRLDGSRASAYCAALLHSAEGASLSRPTRADLAGVNEDSLACRILFPRCKDRTAPVDQRWSKGDNAHLSFIRNPLPSMSTPAARNATYEDLCKVPDHLLAQIIHGQLITLPRPAPRHVRAASSLGGSLFQPMDAGSGGPGGWWILFEPELHLGRDILVPDLGGWRRERMATLPETAFFEIPPDWICEVLSPSTAQMDRVDKLGIYAAHGVAHAWLIDPDANTLEAFSLREGHWRLELALKGSDEVRAPPFDAIAFSLAVLWA